MCITFEKPKCGTGKRTSCASTMGYLAKAGKKVLFVDFDPRNSTSITSVILETKVPNLHIAPSEPDLSAAEVLMQARRKKSFILKRILAEVKTVYDYILIDLPSSTGQLMFNGLCACERRIVPLEPGIFSLDFFGRLKNIFGDVRNHE